MDWQRVAIHTKTEAIEPLTGALMEAGVNGFEIEDAADFERFLVDNRDYYDCIDDELMKLQHCETVVYIYVKTDAQGMELLASVRETLARLAANDNGIDFGSLELTGTTVFEEDWSTAWKKYFHPLPITERVTIKPTWEEYEPRADEVIIELDPGMAFGTGTHETTRMCIGLIEKYMAPNARVLDVGCGSGILSIAAEKLGAGSVTAVDFDAMCIKVTNENAALNGCHINTLCGDLTHDVAGRYDVVVANIIADVIIRLNEDVSRFLAPDGVYICSGIINTREKDVVESLKAHGFLPIEIVADGDWRAIVSETL